MYIKNFVKPHRDKNLKHDFKNDAALMCDAMAVADNEAIK